MGTVHGGANLGERFTFLPILAACSDVGRLRNLLTIFFWCDLTPNKIALANHC